MADKILIVDDDEGIRSELKDLLDGYEVIEVPSGDEALKLLRRGNEIGLIILDVRMSGASGLDVLAEIKATDPDTGIIIMTGYSTKDVAIEALKSRADDYIEKPIDIERLLESVEKLLDARSGQKDVSMLGMRDKVEKVCRFLERNRFKKVTLKEAAAAIYVSPKYLSRIFRKYTKKGFNDYKLTVKMAAAKDLLATSGCTISQISYKLGYENTESFIRQFKKSVGPVPSAYRKKSQKKKLHKKR